MMLPLFESNSNGAPFKAFHLNQDYPALRGLLNIEGDLIVQRSIWTPQYKFESNSSDVQVERASASGAVDSGLIPSRVKLMTLKLLFTTSLLDV